MRASIVLSTFMCAAVLALPTSAQTLVSEVHRHQALAHYRTGQQLLATERWQPAAEAFQRAIGADPLLTDAHYGLGQALMSMERYVSAIRAFSGAVEAARKVHAMFISVHDRRLHPFEVPAPILLSLGSAHFRNSNEEAAQSYWEAASRADSGLGEVWNNLAVVYKRQGRKDDAEDAVRRAERAGFRVDPRLKGEISGLRR